MKQLLLIGICTLALALLFTTTDPATAPSWVLIVPFLLLFVLLSAIAYALLRKRGLVARAALRIGMLCAFVPVSLLVLQSIGQLTTKDVLALGAFLAVAYFYLSRTKLPS
jgi:hypothetical protein